MLGLVADIGGTHARFALVPDAGGGILHPKILNAVDYASPEEAARAYLGMVGGADGIICAVIACAGPVVDGAVSFVNSNWATSETRFAATMGLQTVRLINDLAAAAWSIPALGEEDLQWIGTQRPPAKPAPVAVLGVGTGCNAACANGGHVFAGEYGHSGFAPSSELDLQFWRRITARQGHASVERLLSGNGLMHIYHAVCAFAEREPDLHSPQEITGPAGVNDPLARDARAAFSRILAAAAGDVALIFGAFGGVYLTGSLTTTPGLTGSAVDFRAQFEAKGRMQPLLAKIPSAVIIHPTPALLGAMRAMLVAQ
jgi:glucokinase